MDASVKRGHDAAESGAKDRTILAVLGATPVFSEAIHVGRPNIGNRQRFLERIETMLDRRYLTNSGPFERELEQRLSGMLGVRYCVAMCNATVALEIAIRALNLTGEVIVPSFTFVATAHALQWQQITPVFCDIDPLTHNINPRKIEHLITPRTSGILAVHLWGRPCAIEELQAIADANGLALLFDAAHAFGCTYGTRKIGGFGRAEVLSFHATKFISAGEGGAVMTNDAALAERMQLMKNFGFAGYDNVISIGTNGKMNELSAARGLSLLRYDEENSPNYHYVVVEVDAREFGLTRDQLVRVLHAENVLARRYFYPGVHRMEPYRSLFPDARHALPETEAVAERVLVLPTGRGVTTVDIETICRIIRYAAENRGSVARALKETQQK
ncbi:MAG: dTDP-4-dehydro-6-deoxyglucose aminotransferase [Verrucomicrobia bacterium]|nr:MAG: dTDP-4-dehydro-6-deoxyglucose aminotransferase [Verrucomicrobiota bacterium]